MQKKISARFFIVFMLFSLGLFLSLLWAYASSIVLAFLIVSAFYPMYNRIKSICRGQAVPASLIMVFFIILVVVIPIVWFVGTLSNEAFEFYSRTSNSVSINQIKEVLEGNSIWASRIRRISDITGVKIDTEMAEKLIGAVGKNVGLFLYNQISSAASNIISLLIHFFLMMLIIYYLFVEGHNLKEYITKLIPIPQAQYEKVILTFKEMGKALIIGNGISGIVQGLLGGLGFLIFGLNSALLWGVIIALMAFIPIIGASVIFIPASIILLVQGDVNVAIAYLSYNVFYSSIIEYFIKPRLIGKELKLNSLLVFIGIVGGIKIFGILGIVYGPLIITIFMTLAEIYHLEYKEQIS